MIDSHQHFWRYTADEFGWVTDDMALLRNDFLPSICSKPSQAPELTVWSPSRQEGR